MDNIIQELKDKVKVTDLLKHYGAKKGNGSASWFCLFHEKNGEHNPSFICKANSTYWKCASGCGQGDIFSLVQKAEQLDFFDTLKWLVNYANIDYQFNSTEQKYALQEKHYEYLRKRGIKRVTAWAFGLRGNNDFIQFPQRRTGSVVGYKNLSITSGKKKKQFFEGEDTKSKLFPDYNITSEVLYIVAGEYDTMYLQQVINDTLPEDNKYTVRCNSTGEKSYPTDLITMLSVNKYIQEIRIVYDNDKSGKEGMDNIASALSELSTPVFKYYYPEDKPEKYDITDYFAEGYSLEEFFNLKRELHKSPKSTEKDNGGVNIPVSKKAYENERLLLSYVLFNNEFMLDILGKLKTEDFLNTRFRAVYAFIHDNFEQMGKINHDTIEHYLSKEFEGVHNELLSGSDGYQIKTYGELEVHIQQQVNYSLNSRFRRFLNKSRLVLQKDPYILSQDLLDFVNENVDKLNTSMASSKVINMRKMKEDFIENDTVEISYKTQFYDLNERLNGGFTEGKLVIIAGRPSLGKTTFTLQLLEHFALQKIKICFYSLETGANEVVHQVFAREYQKNSAFFKYKHVDKSKLKAGEHDEYFLFTDELFCPEDIYNDIKLKARKDGVKIFAIDYFQLMDMAKTKIKTRYEFFTYWSTKFQNLAKAEGILIIFLCQINRTATKSVSGKPTINDLKETGSLEQDAHTILILFSPDKEAQQSSPIVSLMVGKCKNGSVGDIPMIFDRSYSTFYEESGCTDSIKQRFGDKFQTKL